MSLNIREWTLLRDRGVCQACLREPARYVTPHVSSRPAWRCWSICVWCRVHKWASDGLDLHACNPTPPMYYEDVRRRIR